MILALKNVRIQDCGSCSERIKIFGQIKYMEHRKDTDHAIIRIINNKDILCCVHLNSKIYADHKNQREILIEEIMNDIQDVEKELETENTIVLEDSVARSISGNNRAELEDLIVRILTSKRIVAVMQELIRVNQAKKSAVKFDEIKNDEECE